MVTDWEAKYREHDTPWDKGEPSPGLVDFLKQNSKLPKGRVVIPGCGLGHDVRAWASAGFEAVGVDIAPSAVQRCRDVSSSFSSRASYELGDFLLREPEQPFDWIFEHTCFCAIDPAERDRYVRAVHRWLKPGGQFVAVHYLIPNTEGPPFGTSRDEVISRFSTELDLLEDWEPRSYPNRTGLERMFWWRKPAVLVSGE